MHTRTTHVKTTCIGFVAFQPEWYDPNTRYLRSVKASSSYLPHVDHASDTISTLHVLERNIDALQRLPVRDKLINLQFSCHVVVHQVGQLSPSLNTAKGAAFPYPTRHQLECYSKQRQLATLLRSFSYSINPFL